MLYEQAIDTFPEEVTFYSNKAACFFEMRQYVMCIETCDTGLK